MSDALGDPARNAPGNPSAQPTTAAAGDDDALLDNSAEPTDDSPTIISKNAHPQGVPRAEDQAGSVRGRRLAHFELIEPIGVGGMAAVIRARDTQLDRLVALKILPPEMAADPENVRRFHQEARSAARLDHENIARVFYCGEDQRLHFIAFEFVEGENLRTILEKRGRLPIGEALSYVLQVAAGLAHAARRGVVHRDIKPSNVIITPNGRAKLVDMGLARSLEPSHDGGLTQSGVTLGTFDYISPEQALEPRDADVRSDIYSLGCTFYHLLTGQPPVPEGTAAKKLHHHQHVKPPDPRQLVPDLPDEAAIILDRMMAKHPKDRYQTPEQLVHHLYLAARKLGADAEVSEGVLAIEAALPQPPGSRPLVLAAFAALAVVVLIFLIDLASGPKTEPVPEPPTRSGSVTPAESADGTSALQNPPAPAIDKGKPTPDQPKKKNDKPVADNPPTFQVNAKDERPAAVQLADFFKQHQRDAEIIVELDDELELGGDITTDLIVANPKVTIRPRAGHRPLVRDSYRNRPGQLPQASLIVDSPACIIKDIRFFLNQQSTSDRQMAMLRFRGCRNVRVEGCEFIQAHPTGENSRMTSVLVEQGSEPGMLTLLNCCFVGFKEMKETRGSDGRMEMVFEGAASGGQDAVTRRGPVSIDARNCVFGPHAAAFYLEGNAEGDKGIVSLTHCSILAARPSAVFDLADGADARIQTHFLLVSYLGDPGMLQGKGAVLLRRRSSQGTVSYEGLDNRYHQLDNLLDVAKAADKTVQRLLDELNKKDQSRTLKDSPWKDAEPLKKLEQLAFADAFAVKAELPQLRVAGSMQSRDRQGAGNNDTLIGAERVLAFSYLDKLPDVKQDPSATPHRELIVEKRDNHALGRAFLDAQPGDRIHLRLDGEIKIDGVLGWKQGGDLCVVADPGFHPILTLDDSEDADPPSFLFDVHHGKLQVQGLEIRLHSRQEDGDGSAVVCLGGDGECQFKDCLVTLEKSSVKTALAVLPSKRTKKSTSQTPHLMLENCLVRGQGDLVWARGSRAAKVSLDNSLIALSGSLLNVESDKDREAPASDAEVKLRLAKVTTYLGENLIRLRAAKDVKGLVKTVCEASECLLLPIGERALIRLEGASGQERDLRDKFVWESSGKNAYGNFTALLEQQSLDDKGKSDMMRMQPTPLDEWKTKISGETDSEYNVKLPNPPAADTDFTQLAPPGFQPSDSLKGYGADLAKLRDLPALKGHADVSESEDKD